MLTLPGSLLSICVMLTDNKQISRLSARNTGKRCLRGLSTSHYQKADLGQATTDGTVGFIDFTLKTIC